MTIFMGIKEMKVGNDSIYVGKIASNSYNNEITLSHAL